MNTDDREQLIPRRRSTRTEGINDVDPVSYLKQNEGAVPIGSLNVLSSQFESLDYDICENKLLMNEAVVRGYAFVTHKSLARWLIFLMIGVCTAFVGIFINISIEQLSDIKYSTIKSFLDSCSAKECMYKPYFVWVGINAASVLVGSLLVTFCEPIALGSGIPQVKCYLNGIKMPRIVRIKTLFVKTIGVISTVVGGLCAGKEGPMIHSGAVVAAGISQGKSTTFSFLDLSILTYFREDHEKRDFVSGGAAAGVASAFGAPVGGVLFSLEEGASFWNQSLTWRIFFASIISTFTLNIVLSAYHGHPGDLTFAGLLNFGEFTKLSYEIFELPFFLMMGAFGGLTGALFNHINYKITVFRMRYIRPRWLKVMEALSVAALSATVALLMMFWISDCKSLGTDPTTTPVQLYCGDGEYNTIASLWLQVPEATVRSLFHDPNGAHNMSSLAYFAVVYYILSIWTYGLSVSGGLFIPCLVTGAAWGRLVGLSLETFFPDCSWCMDPGKYALVGAAAQLGGVVRMTISLTVIMIEATGNISFGLPLMITLIMAKWVGDYFNEGIYDIHIQLSGVPLLAWEPPPLNYQVQASAIMSHPPCVLRTVESVRHIVSVLQRDTFNGFPVIDPHSKSSNTMDGIRSSGRLRGLILRSQLIVLLQNKLFNIASSDWENGRISMKIFRKAYPRYGTIDEITLTEEELSYTLDLRPFMNPSPYTIPVTASLPRVFRLFRALGLRHLIVVNDFNEVVGMVTRKDLARYRVWRHFGRTGVEELKIS
ncbi:H(+)/Cl(-) exchange transporter 7-like [Macrosteles quadrilineatus]|uniref:H(+)/Cl(-) exchange transporter 7-like n=1 Tax=Macrosteles quadrilineatus TaxID=74068 RepID=UPI0023E1294F|nr:H(+)/Cl(-) exchange transporter 7-like [Macrosteles quadrilineatus]